MLQQWYSELVIDLGHLHFAFGLSALPFDLCIVAALVGEGQSRDFGSFLSDRVSCYWLDFGNKVTFDLDLTQ